MAPRKSKRESDSSSSDEKPKKEKKVPAAKCLFQCRRCGETKATRFAAQRHGRDTCWHACDECVEAREPEPCYHDFKIWFRTLKDPDLPDFQNRPRCTRCIEKGLLCHQLTASIYDADNPLKVPKPTDDERQSSGSPPVSLTASEDSATANRARRARTKTPSNLRPTPPTGNEESRMLPSEVHPEHNPTSQRPRMPSSRFLRSQPVAPANPPMMAPPSFTDYDPILHRAPMSSYPMNEVLMNNPVQREAYMRTMRHAMANPAPYGNMMPSSGYQQSSNTTFSSGSTRPSHHSTNTNQRSHAGAEPSSNPQWNELREWNTWPDQMASQRYTNVNQPPHAAARPSSSNQPNQYGNHTYNTLPASSPYPNANHPGYYNAAPSSNRMPTHSDFGLEYSDWCTCMSCAWHRENMSRYR